LEDFLYLKKNCAQRFLEKSQPTPASSGRKTATHGFTRTIQAGNQLELKIKGTPMILCFTRNKVAVMIGLCHEKPE
jgi:hypothetical protein